MITPRLSHSESTADTPRLNDIGLNHELLVPIVISRMWGDKRAYERFVGNGRRASTVIRSRNGERRTGVRSSAAGNFFLHQDVPVMDSDLVPFVKRLLSWKWSGSFVSVWTRRTHLSPCSQATQGPGPRASRRRGTFGRSMRSRMEHEPAPKEILSTKSIIADSGASLHGKLTTSTSMIAKLWNA
jgi:hypothetical protein